MRLFQNSAKPPEQTFDAGIKFEKLSRELDEETGKLGEIEEKELEIGTLEKGQNEEGIFQMYGALYECYIDLISEMQNYSKIDRENGIELISEVKFKHIRFDQNFSGKISKNVPLARQFGNMFGEADNQFVFRTERHVADVRKIFDELVKGDDAVRLKQGFNLDDVVHSLMDDNFYIEYDLKQGDDRLLQMSPGKRGIILFELFLELSGEKHRKGGQS